jgi:hypothetical protein
VNYEFNKGLITISADIAFGVDDSTEWITKFNEFFFWTLPWKIAKVKNLGRGLSVSELVLGWCWHALISFFADSDCDEEKVCKYVWLLKMVKSCLFVAVY